MCVHKLSMGRMNQANESRSKNVAPWKILEDFVHLTTIMLKITFLLKFLTLDIFIHSNYQVC